MMLERLRRPLPIFAHSLLLVTSVAVAVTALAVLLILFRPPPPEAPLTPYEIARLLRGQEIVKDWSSLRISLSAQEPRSSASRADGLLRTRIAAAVGKPASDIRFWRPERTGSAQPGPSNRPSPREMTDRNVEREHDLYAADGGFNPPIFGAFEAAVRLSNGQWRVVARLRRDPVERWQVTTILLIIGAMLVVLAIAWMFSKRLARPIKQFMSAAEGLGRGLPSEPIRIEGPVEIRAAAAALERMQERIRRHVAERTTVIGAIAHDLRTPLSRLNFHIAAAPDEIRIRAEAEIAEMEALIATTLDFVQSETRAHLHEPIDLALLVEGVVDDFADTGRPTSLVESAPALVSGDSVLLKRLFANLIQNAITYGSVAEVSVRVAGGEALVAIADKGPGLLPADLERAFEPFFRAETSRNRATGGMGLGLAIVQSAAKVHRGSVRLCNRQGGGLRAEVRLPLIAPPDDKRRASTDHE